MTTTVDIVRTLVENYAPKSAITAVEDLGSNSWKLTVCKLFNTRPLRRITIDGELYDVTAIDADAKTITVTSTDDLSSAVLYYPPAITFFHGTPIATQQELAKIKDTVDKLPMIYLLEIIEDKHYPSKQDARDRDAQIRLFFLDEANYQDWDTDHHYSGAIVPMANLAVDFMDEYLFYHKQLDKFEPYSLIYHPKFNPQINFNGVLESLFPDQVSGVEIKVTLPVRKTFTCNC